MLIDFLGMIAYLLDSKPAHRIYTIDVDAVFAERVEIYLFVVIDESIRAGVYIVCQILRMNDNDPVVSQS